MYKQFVLIPPMDVLGNCPYGVFNRRIKLCFTALSIKVRVMVNRSVGVTVGVRLTVKGVELGSVAGLGLGLVLVSGVGWIWCW